MADVTSHRPGTFSWPELSTSNQAAGVAFYRSLFGWGVDEQPIGPGEVYSMFQLRGKPVGAASTMRAMVRRLRPCCGAQPCSRSRAREGRAAAICLSESLSAEAPGVRPSIRPLRRAQGPTLSV